MMRQASVPLLALTLGCIVRADRPPLMPTGDSLRRQVLSGASRSLSGQVGCHRITMRATAVVDARAFSVRPSRAAFVAITEAHADTPGPVTYHYLVTGDGIEPYERVVAARGFGPVTFYLPVQGRAAGRLTIRNLAGPASAPWIAAVRGVTPEEMDRARRTDRFALMGIIGNAHLGMSEDEQAATLARLPTLPERGVSRGMCYEIYYAAWDAAAVRGQIERARAWSRQHGVPLLLGFVSWWKGTPRRVPDGLGGTFGDLKYQQVCYTPGAEHEEDAGLRELLGARYSRHYRRSVPNIWSNTPWLTMNSPVLNAHRARRLAETFGSLKEVCAGDTSWVAGVFLENEPRYWDTQSTEGTPQWAGEQWADFNPMTVEQARREGVTLDPSDGMSPAELAWLQSNVGRYFQETVDAALAGMRKHGLSGRFPIMTHSLQLARLFPGSMMHRSPADWALARGAQTGIEGIWSNLSDFDRVREWGPWCNLNRESTDGAPVATHLWDLRAAYAQGATLYNAYNWHVLGPDAYLAYARQFVEGLPRVTVRPAHVAAIAPDAFQMTLPQELQAFDTLDVPLRITANGARRVEARVEHPDGRVWHSSRTDVPSTGLATVTFRFPAPAEGTWHGPLTVRLRAYGADDEAVSGAVALQDDAAGRVQLSLDLATLRALSRIVMARRQGAVR